MTWLRHPYTIYVIVVSLCVGVGWATFAPVTFGTYGIIAVVACMVAGAMRLCPSWRIWGRYFLLALVVCAAGLVRTEYVEQQLYDPILQERVGEHADYIGTVVQEPERGARSQQVVLEVADTSVLIFTERYRDVRYGDVWQVTGELATPEPFSAEQGRIFPYDDYLAAQGVAWVILYPEMERIDQGQGLWWLQALYTLKDRFRTQLHQVLPEPQVALGEGLLLGVKSALGEELETAFRTTGLIHIVVLSGFNVMLVVAFLQYIVGFFLPLRPRVWFALAGIVAFAFLVGLSATVVRASLMASLYLLAQYFGRHYEAIRGLWLAGAIMVWWQPLTLLYDIGFQLSFMATLGLILVSPRLESWLVQAPRSVAWRSYGVATVATQVAILPLLLYHIGEFSIVAPVINMLVLPVVALAMASTLAVGVVSWVWPELALWLSGLAQLPLTYIIELARLGAALPFASVWVPAFSVWWVVVAYGVMGLMWYYGTRRRSQPTAAPGLPTERAHALGVVPITGWSIRTTHQNPPRDEVGG